MSERDPLRKGPAAAGPGVVAPDSGFGGPDRDKLIEETEREMAEHSAASRLFDIRFLIGGLFVLYGVIVYIVGLVDNDKAKDAANGTDINLWTGFGMFVVGVLFLVWGYFGRDALGRTRTERAAAERQLKEHLHQTGRA